MMMMMMAAAFAVTVLVFQQSRMVLLLLPSTPLYELGSYSCSTIWDYHSHDNAAVAGMEQEKQQRLLLLSRGTAAINTTRKIIPVPSLNHGLQQESRERMDIHHANLIAINIL